MDSIIGLDVGIKACEVCGINEIGAVLRRMSASTSASKLIEAIMKFPEPRIVVVEESTPAQWIADILRPYARVVVVDARHNRLISEAMTKSDRLDAQRLAELYRVKAVREVYHPSDSNQVEYKRMVQQYEDLTREVVVTKNRIHAIYRQYGCVPKSKHVFHPKLRGDMLKMLPEEGQQRAGRWYEVLDKMAEMQKATLKKIVKTSQGMDVYRRLMTIPGMGPVSASTFIGHLQTPERFQRAKQVWSYSRLGIVERDSSGKRLVRPHLSRQGIGRLKSATRRVFETALRKEGGLNGIAGYYLRCRKRGVEPIHARLTTQRKILTVVWTLWKKKEVFDPKKLLMNERV